MATLGSGPGTVGSEPGSDARCPKVSAEQHCITEVGVARIRGPSAAAGDLRGRHPIPGPTRDEYHGAGMIDLWAAAQRFIGRWEGPATGRPGRGRQVREYKAILRGRFILGTDETCWIPTPEEPHGLVHEDLSVLSFDRGSGQLVLRGFYGEGFVHEYRCVEADGEGTRFVFEAAQVENGPPGMRARETIVFPDPDVLESTFELAMQGGDFEAYTHEHLERTPS